MARHKTTAMFHATAMVRDYDAAVRSLERLIGLRVLECGEESDPAIGRRGGMTWVGDGSLELCEPIVDGAPPDRFVRRTGGGMQGLALLVEDFEATVSHLEQLEVPMPVRMPAGFGFSSPRATAGLQLEWSEFTVDEDPRLGAPVPPFACPPVLDVTHLAFVGAVVDDPCRDAHRFAAICATDVAFEHPRAPVGTAAAGVLLGDCVLALFQRQAGELSDTLWARRFDRPRVSLLGVRVDDLGQARRALSEVEVTILDERAGMMVLDPSSSASVEIAVVEELLPGDPRVVAV